MTEAAAALAALYYDTYLVQDNGGWLNPTYIEIADTN
ncbi:MAG: hypothetical protein IRD7MM_02960 [Candidatus Midichloria mitochondrii]